MTMTVLDSTDLTGILADAGVTLGDPVDKPADKPKEAEGEAAKGADKTAEAQEDPDDIEGEDGLTPREKRELTDKMQKAIGKKHRLVKEAEEFAAAQYSERKLADQRAENLAQELAALKANAAPKKVEEVAVKPERQNFANENDYVDAMIEFGLNLRLAEKAEEDRKAIFQRERDQIMETAKERIARAIELVPDYAEVTGAVDTEVPRAIAGYMQKSEMFAELGYHLAKNPEILVSLAKLPADEQLVKIGKIESTLSPFESRKEAQHDDTSSKEAPNGKATKAAPSTDTGIDLSKPRSKAAPVFAPLDGSGSAGIAKDSKDMNIRESIEDYAKRNRINLNARRRH